MAVLLAGGHVGHLGEVTRDEIMTLLESRVA
jgi:hypothetical protein